jgi:hypothetical protein
MNKKIDGLLVIGIALLLPILITLLLLLVPCTGGVETGRPFVCAGSRDLGDFIYASGWILGFVLAPLSLLSTPLAVILFIIWKSRKRHERNFEL